jgi:glyoxylase-like metal-dependent hydrolase (beta-lactamase superfamily II)
MSVYTIDCQYVYPELAAAYLLIEGDEAAFVENNTSKAVPILLEELKKHNISNSKVKYIIITHVHLDHASGTAALLEACPNAKVIAHPRAAPHLIAPKRLIESAKKVYGEDNFTKLYGTINEVTESSIYIPTDGETIKWGSRYLKFIYTRGHANHHFVVFDSLSNGIFTGDSFGIGYPLTQKGKAPFLFPSTTPTDFDPIEAKVSVQKILSTGADKAYLTHFGVWEYMKEGAKQLISGLNYMEEVLLLAQNPEISDESLDAFVQNKVSLYLQKEVHNRGLPESVFQYLDLDIEINAMGISFAARRARKKQG